MTKDDWLKLAMPASITLLALSVITTPLMVKAQLMESLRIYQGGAWVFRVENVDKNF